MYERKCSVFYGVSSNIKCGVGAGGEKRRSRCPCARAAGMRRKTLHLLGYGRQEESTFASRLYQKRENNSVRVKSGKKEKN